MKPSQPNARYYLGIDPGRDKTGLALVREDGVLRSQQVVRTSSLRSSIRGFLDERLASGNVWSLHRVLAGIIIGNGTNSGPVCDLVKELFPSVPVHEIGEAHSTEEARRLYWKIHPSQGLRRLLPLGLQVPPVPLDGYAAVVQVRRYLAALAEQEEIKKEEMRT